MTIWIVSLIIIVTLALLITEVLPIDLTAMGVMAALMITGVLTPAEAVRGFANSAVITVGAMFIISRALVRTGVVGMIARKVIDHSRGNVKMATFLILLIVGGASAFINNTPVVVLFIPIILSLSCEFDFSPSKYLLPISYASILAGTCTLIGTSTNILVGDISAMHGYGKLGMFELTPLGVPIAVLGLAFLYLFSHHLMPSHATPTCDVQDGVNRKYLTEFLVPEGSPLINRNASELLGEKYPTVELFEIIRGYHIFYPDQGRIKVSAGDILFVKGSASDIVSLLNEGLVRLPDVAGNIEVTVASSVATESLLGAAGVEVAQLNDVGEIDLYIDGADEVNKQFHLIKGGGGALTREKILAGAARRFVCIVDESKRVGVLGNFPLPVEVIPMAEAFVARQFVKVRGQPVLRPDYRTDNGNSILRYNRAMRLLSEYYGQLTPELFRTLLADHAGYPTSICKHGLETVTVFSIIIQLEQRCAWIGTGRACQASYTEYKLEPWPGLATLKLPV